MPVTTYRPFFVSHILFYSRVNPVEKIYASFPFFLFINSTYAGQLLSPLLEFQDTPFNSQPFAACDIGKYIFAICCSILERDLTQYRSELSPS